jgi:glycosyltransferase involved in cell wall biosynthesis
MRVTHVITRLIIGGAQENTLLTCEGLLRRYGDDVLLVTGPGMGPEGSLENEARRRKIPMVIVPELRREIHPLRDAASYRALRRELKRFAPQVVHTHSGKAGLLGRMAAYSLDIPAIVHTIHGAPFHRYQGRGARAVIRACEHFAARRCHLLVSVADAMTDQLVAAKVAPREKFVTVYSGMEVEPYLNADRNRSEVRQAMGYTDEAVVVGKIARLFHLKGYPDVLCAARQVADRFPNVRFLFVGGGILESALRAQAARAGLAARIQWTGLVPPERIADLIGAMDVVVHASLREGLARVLPQALLAGRPVVSYDIDGAREVVFAGQTGFLVPPGDITALASAISQLVADPALRMHMGSEGRRRFTDRFRHTTMVDQLRSLYEKVLEFRNRDSGARDSGAQTLFSDPVGH